MAGRKGDGDGKHKALHGEPTHHTRERETKEESSSSSPRKQSSLLSASDQTSFTCSINKNLTITKHQDLKTIFFFFFSELTIKKVLLSKRVLYVRIKWFSVIGVYI